MVVDYSLRLVIYSNDIFRKTYNSDRFESVTKPASWSMLGSAGEDAIHVSFSDSGVSRTFQYTLDILSF